MLKEVVPEISRVTVLSNPTVPSNALLVKEAEVATRSLKLRLQVEYAEAGGLMAYGASIREHWRRAAIYVDISKHVGRVNRELIVVDAVAA